MKGRFFSQHPASQSRARAGQSGVALVITLILLSVITFMAIAFLVLSRGERSSVATVTDEAVARLAADNALEQAKVQLIGPMMTGDNPFNFDLLVSTNYVNPLGFQVGPAIVQENVTNAAYVYPNGTALSAAHSLQNLANLYFSPRPPVFVSTPLGNGVSTQDFRFYLDLNRNGRYDTNGFLPELAWDGTPIFNTNGLPFTNFFVGDPEWIGGLEYPDRRHSRTNRFLYRYAYLVVPAGKTLDINYIHNAAKEVAGARTPPYDFFRNQGVGSWEINLAAFLRDLNTNIWYGDPSQSYWYRTANPSPLANAGTAFDDALDVLRYRNKDFPNVGKSFANLFGPVATDVFTKDGIDGYSAAVAPMLATGLFPIDPDTTVVNRHWFGADSVNHYFTTQDLFDPTKSSLAFVNKLRMVGQTNNSSYDRYSYYRLISQLGTDSAADPDDRINLNYDNRVQSNARGVIAATNFIPWEPIHFFTVSANRLLANAGYNFDVSRIQIYPTNFYTPSVHRLLQLAANIYDATTNRHPAAAGTNMLGLPSVFRPLFLRTDTNGVQVWITGYEPVNDWNQVNVPAVDLDLAMTNNANINPRDMVYGFPVIIGAKKGFPNFNELAMQTEVNVTRKLQFWKKRAEDPTPSTTNQMYMIGISNRFGVEAWNSYSNEFGRRVEMQVAIDVQAVVSNQYNQIIALDNPLIRTGFTRIFAPGTPDAWQGFSQFSQASFKTPFHPATNNFFFLTNRPYSTLTRQFMRNAINWESGFDVPHLWLCLKMRLRYLLIDLDTRRLIDYVNVAQTEEPLYITRELISDLTKGRTFYEEDDTVAGIFNTNRGVGITDIKTPTFGVRNQIGIGLGKFGENLVWNPPPTDPGGRTIDASKNFFYYNLLGTERPGSNSKAGRLYKTNEFYAPFAPTRTIFFFTSWQANDPLVHYTIGDLFNLQNTNRVEFNSGKSTLANIGKVNDRYEPWGGNSSGQSSSSTKYQYGVKDPLIERSDDWDFPTHKFPNVGWIGRVHRGTPWQTVYLKAPEINARGLWQKWTGNFQTVTNWNGKGNWKLDADFTVPQRDRELLDVFTTALTENGSRGRLSINQSGLAAWSAVLSGVVAITNLVSDAVLSATPEMNPVYGAALIEPAGVYNPFDPTPMARIVQAINNVRANSTNQFPKKSFMRLGDILSVPELTIGQSPAYVGTYPNGYWTGVSPYLNLGNPLTMDRASKMTGQQINMLNDAAYERIPQQVLGLLHCDPPRFVVYSFGQALKPAPESVVSASGAFFGMVTNYQVTAESATRAVIRVEGAPDNPRVVVENFNVLPSE